LSQGKVTGRQFSLQVCKQLQGSVLDSSIQQPGLPADRIMDYQSQQFDCPFNFLADYFQSGELNEQVEDIPQETGLPGKPQAMGSLFYVLRLAPTKAAYLRPTSPPAAGRPDKLVLPQPLRSSTPPADRTPPAGGTSDRLADGEIKADIACAGRTSPAAEHPPVDGGAAQSQGSPSQEQQAKRCDQENDSSAHGGIHFPIQAVPSQIYRLVVPSVRTTTLPASETSLQSAAGGAPPVMVGNWM
jgi:hypothetical protein